MKQILGILIILITLTGLTIDKETEPDIEGLLNFLETLDGSQPLKKQKLKIIKERKAPYYLASEIDNDKAKSVECTFKNKFFPNATECELYLDYFPTKTFHRIVHYKYTADDLLKRDFLDATEKMKWSYLHWQTYLGKEYEFEEKQIEIKYEDVASVDKIKGYRIWKNEHLWDKYYVEIHIWESTHTLEIELFDYRGIKK